MADDEPWKLIEDGYLNVGEDSENIIYHPNLNIIIVVTRARTVLVLDVNTGVLLHKSCLSAYPNLFLHGVYLDGCDKVLFFDGKGIGLRRDYNGVVLLDTILQTPLTKEDDVVKLELILSEAILLQQTMRCVELPGNEHTTELLEELNTKIKEGQLKRKKGTKAQKWNTICLKIRYCALKAVCAALVQELKRQNRHIPALSVASVVHERLNCLLPSYTADGALTDRALMFSEAARRETFVKWPHMNYKWALPDQMAQAGFYHQPNSTGDDRAMCFTCNVCLVCWEPTDEPWSEHERHSPSCPFVKGEYTQNVPLSVTFATSPAMVFGDMEDVNMLGTSSVPDLVATGSRSGLVVVWNVLKQLKLEVSFYINLPQVATANAIDSACYNDIKCDQEKPGRSAVENLPTADAMDIPLPEMNMDDLLETENDKCVEMSAVSIVSGPQQQKCQSRKKTKSTVHTHVRPCIIGGIYVLPSEKLESKSSLNSASGIVNEDSSMVHVLNDMNVADNKGSAPFDIMNATKSDDCGDCVRDKSVGLMKSCNKRRPVYLVVYDIFYQSHSGCGYSDGKQSGSKAQPCQAGNSAKKDTPGTGTSSSSGTRQENNVYQEIFLSKFLYDVPVIEDVDPGLVMAPSPAVLMDGLEFPAPSSSGDLCSATGGAGNTSSTGAVASTYGTPSVKVKYISLGEEGNASNYPSTSDDCPPPLIRLHCSSKEDDCGSDTNTVDGDTIYDNPKPGDPVEIQCISLPDEYNNRNDMYVSHICPTKDGGHLLVVLATLTSGIFPLEESTFDESSSATSAVLDDELSVGKNVAGLDVELKSECGHSNPDISRNNENMKYGALLMYSLNFEDEVVKVDEVPINIVDLESSDECPRKITLLPLLEMEDCGDSSCSLSLIKGCPLGLAALVCRDGIVRILDLATLKILSMASPEKKGTKFVSATYCNSLERLCVCTDKGSLHFFLMNDEREMDDREDEIIYQVGIDSVDCFQREIECSTSDTSLEENSGDAHSDLFSYETSPSASSTSFIQSSAERLLVNEISLELSDLQSLYELTQYENLSPIFAATVPPCWIEIMQAQKQRRHPQHLQQGDDLQHTRSWRLQNDVTSWNEHVFEITVPRSCCIGHVDLKFSLHSPCTVLPHLQFTLLKLNASGIGKKEKMGPHVDETVDFSMNKSFDGSSKGSMENSATPDEYMEDENTEILCGPVNLSTCLDLSDTCGNVTLTSPKLHRLRGRTLLLHIKAVAVQDEQNARSREKSSSTKRSKVDHGNGRLIDRMMEYLYNKESSERSNKKREQSVGCDWLNEISVTIRKTKPTSVPNERNQRCAMLESNSFIEKLLQVIYLQGSNKTENAQNMALDILNWVASVRLTRLRTSQGDAKAQQLGFIRIIEANLKYLIQYCILLSGRSIANKCVKLIAICSEGMKNVLDTHSVSFDMSVLRALLDMLPQISSCKSAGAMRWYFLLLTKILPVDLSFATGHKCTSLLLQVAQELKLRSNPYHLLLKSRFGLYNTPLEAELFDIEPPAPCTFSSFPLTYASVVNGEKVGATSASPGGGYSSETLDLKDLLGPGVAGTSDSKSNTVRFKRLSSNHHLKGLLEVEPLHFKCHAASDGTKMEKIETGTAGGGSVAVGSIFEPSNVITASSGSKKADNDFMSFLENIKKEDLIGYKKDSKQVAAEKDDAFLDALKKSDGYMTLKKEDAYHEVMSQTTIEMKVISHKGTQKLTSIFEAIEKEAPKEKSGDQDNQTNSAKCSMVIYENEGSGMDEDTSSTSSQESSVLSGPIVYENITRTSQVRAKRNPVEYDTKKQENKKIGESNSALPWQQLLITPSQHVLVVDRMHSGARRFVVLDFGSPILLTDLLIPACADLVSLSIDIWCQGEETDGQRLVVASDIGIKSLVMSDLQPPPVCRYLKITAIGRYGMSTTKCKIPVGNFFGHIVVLPGEGYAEANEVPHLSESSIQAQLVVLSALFEDIHCRYGLACAKLQEFLAPYLNSEVPNVMHMHRYFRRGKELEKFFPSPQAPKILSAYAECVTFQHQLNLIRNVVKRLESAKGDMRCLPTTKDTQKLLAEACTDKLRVLADNLLDILLHLTYEIGPVQRVPVTLYKSYDQSLCQHLFESLCVKEDTHMQLSTCTLLVRMCGLQPWWGDFLANNLVTFYNSQYTDIIPQDRVFILLTYMAKKALSNGATCTAVLDSVLCMLTGLLSPLAEKDIGFLKAEMDLYQVQWVLLFLSVCLDANGNGFLSLSEDPKGKTKEREQASSRWDFIQGEIAIQRRLATSIRNSTRGIRRKIQKRLMHNKQQLEDLETAKKAFHSSTQALSVLSSQAANLSTKLEAALKQQDQFMKKNLKQHSAKHGKETLQARKSEASGFNNQSFSSRSPSSAVHSREKEETERDISSCLLQASCLPVARALVAFILQLDFTCNVDTFLLACKVIARIVASTRPAITLGELMNEDQLLRLLRLGVWNDQHKVPWGGPWASHTISCLLQDILESVRLFPSMENISSDLLSDSFNSPIRKEPVSELCSSSSKSEDSSRTEDSIDSASRETKGNGYLLPSLLESDDSDIDDILDEYLEARRSQSKKGHWNRVAVNATSSISGALDARLEYGVEESAHVALRRLEGASSFNLPLSVNAPIQALPDAAKQPPSSSWDDSVLAPWKLPPDFDPPQMLQMLTSCFDKLFIQLHVQNSWSNLERILQLWLTLNNESTCYLGGPGNFDPAASPSILLTPAAVSGLISALAFHPGISLRAWCLAFQCLTMLANMPYIDCTASAAAASWSPETVEDIENSLRGLAKVIIEDPNFVPMLLRFLMGSGLNMSSAKISAGPSVCHAFHDLLVRLQMRCEVVTINSKVGNSLKERLLKLVYQLVQPTGAVANHLGPLDAQSRLIDLLLNFNFFNVDLSTAMSILESLGVLVYTCILDFGPIKCHSSSEVGVGPSTSFSGILGASLGAESSLGQHVTWEFLMCKLLKLASRLVQTPLMSPLSMNVGRRENGENVDIVDKHGTLQAAQLLDPDTNDCQTDEHKAAEQQNSNDGSRQQQGSRQVLKVPCVANTVLQHYPTMLRLLSALAGCETCSLALLIATAAPTEQIIIEALGDVGEPVTVADCIFQLLMILSLKATSPELILKPIFDFLSTTACGILPQMKEVGVTRLSEPMMWYMLRVLNSEKALQIFTDMGGVKVISHHLVRSCQSLISDHPSLVSVLMQHFSSISPAITFCEMKTPSPIETFEGLMNFAPLGTISSSNPTAQPADVLIHSAPPHRRARTPAWTYHFFPDEFWMDLVLSLPCAVMLKEIHLQPHLTSLATCPSAVAVEVSRDSSSGLIPICPPVQTSGLTFIRLQLSQPEIVTSVLLRLYKPCDSANIGLSQIRLLGFTTFGETLGKQNKINVPHEEIFSKSSLGWLRLLHHCIYLPPANSSLTSSVLTSAAKVDGLIEACSSLLLIPAPSPYAFMPKLEGVLIKLGLHSEQLGLQMVNILLRRGPAAFISGTWPVYKSDVYSSPAINAVVDLLYQFGTVQDSATQKRIRTYLHWLRELAMQYIQDPSVDSDQTLSPSSAYIHCAAAILWSSRANGVDINLCTLATPELFGVLYNWAMILPPHSALKRAVDAVLCSLCYLQPVLFPMLLQRMGVLVTNLATHHKASISDDRKDHEPDELSASITDDSKERVIGEEQTHGKSEWYNHLMIQDIHRLQLNECQLSTLAMACQSPPAIRQLLDSGFPTLLTQSIVDFCNREHQIQHFDTTDLCDSDEFESKFSSQLSMTDADKASDQGGKAFMASHTQGTRSMLRADSMAIIMNFLAEVCAEATMRDWLGSAEGSVFWLPLLTLLCTKSSPSEENEEHEHSKCEMTNESYAALETATVKFLCRCCWCHPANQLLLSDVLCKVMNQQQTVHQNVTFLHDISGFTRRLVLQLLLENEKILVYLKANFPLDHSNRALPLSIPNHPRYGAGHNNQVLYVSTQSTLSDLVRYVTDLTLPTTSIELVMPTLPVHHVVLYHSVCPGVSLPCHMTLSQILTLIQQQDGSLSTPCISFTVVKQAMALSKESKESSTKSEYDNILLSTPGLPTPLQIFTQQGGLAMLAHHLPLVYPDTLRYSSPEKVTTPDTTDGEWVKVEAGEDIYEDVDDSVAPSGSSPSGTNRGAAVAALSVPPHSLAAFGLFLRLPGYADVLLKEKKKAQCLLRLVLGVTDDGEGGDIFSSPIANSLHTSPFQVLRQLFDSTPLTTDDGVLLRRTTIDIGAVHLLLGCLSVFTHQSQDINLPGVQHELVIAATKATSSTHDSRGKSDDKSHLYWAKGTGFGTGSTAQSWNVEQALLRQRSEEEHVTVLLQVLSSYINPGGTMSCKQDSGEIHIHDVENECVSDPSQLPALFHDLLKQSCLLPAISSYLRNDSVLDMSRHIPLYLAVLELLRAMALSSQLVSLLLPQDMKQKSGKGEELSIVCLLTKMKECVNTYASRLKTERTDKTSKGNGKSPSTIKNKEEAEQDEGLARLIPDVQLTASVVEDATHKLVLDNSPEAMIMKERTHANTLNFSLGQSLEEKYLQIMKALQFDTFEMISECREGGYQFVVSYHFESNMRSAGDKSHPSRMKRLAQEAVTLSTSLPLSYSSSVFVRCDADRLDIMKVLITGPAETPYANGCFEFDVYFPPDYPNSPMLINMETTGHHTVRFNPNLYNDGRVCLSVLNTWHGRPEEKWNAQTSSFLQVLVSIQSLILVPEPYFNEPGYERSRGTPSGNQSSREYNSNICQNTVKWAMLEQVRNPCPCFKEVIHTHFWMKRKEIINQIESWLSDMKNQTGDRRSGRIITFNALALERNFVELREELNSLKVPEGLEDFQNMTMDVLAFPSNNRETETNSITPVDSITTSQSVMVFETTPVSNIIVKDEVEMYSSQDIDTDLEMEKMVSEVCDNV